MKALTPIRVLAVSLDGQVVLRIYRAATLEIEAPLSPRLAVVLARDLLSAAFDAEREAHTVSLFELEPEAEQRIASRSESPGHGRQCGRALARHQTTGRTTGRAPRATVGGRR